jgi:hypothetical protein
MTMTIAGLAHSQATTVVVVTHDLCPADRVLRLEVDRLQATSGPALGTLSDHPSETTGAP